jgi:hypothetical protein
VNTGRKRGEYFCSECKFWESREWCTRFHQERGYRARRCGFYVRANQGSSPARVVPMHQLMIIDEEGSDDA